MTFSERLVVGGFNGLNAWIRDAPSLIEILRISSSEQDYNCLNNKIEIFLTEIRVQTCDSLIISILKLLTYIVYSKWNAIMKY